jgi:hypothetical protein
MLLLSCKVLIVLIWMQLHFAPYSINVYIIHRVVFDLLNNDNVVNFESSYFFHKLKFNEKQNYMYEREGNEK